MLDFVDEELVEALQYHLRGLGLVLRLGEEVAGVERRSDGDVADACSPAASASRPTPSSTPPAGRARPTA